MLYLPIFLKLKQIAVVSTVLPCAHRTHRYDTSEAGGADQRVGGPTQRWEIDHGNNRIRFGDYGRYN